MGGGMNFGQAVIPHGLKRPTFHKRSRTEGVRSKQIKIECDRIYLPKARRSRSAIHRPTDDPYRFAVHSSQPGRGSV